MLTMTPLYNINAVRNVWSIISQGVQSVLDRSADDTSMQKIYNQLLAGELLLWEAKWNGEYCGFVTTTLDNSNPNYRCLWVVHLYISKGSEPDVLIDGMHTLEDYAKKCGCTRMKFYSLRHWERKMKDKGFHPSYVEFVKEVR